jgi:predicted lactoylglutathione lyase
MSEKGVWERATPVLPSQDLHKTAAFYEQKLGFKPAVLYDQEGYLVIERDNITLHFFHAKEFDPTKDAGVCYIYVSQVEALYQEYLAAGVTHPNGRLEHTPWNMYEFVVLDLDNNLLRLGERSK